MITLLYSCLATAILCAATIYQTQSADFDDSELHHYRSEIPLSIIKSTASAICGSRLAPGIISEETDVSCTSNFCNATHTTSAAYYEGDVFLTPTLDLLVPQQYYATSKQLKGHMVQVTTKYRDTNLSISIDVRQEAGMTKDELQKLVPWRCYRTVGKKLIDKMKPYEVGSIIVSARGKGEVDRSVTEVFRIEEMDHALLEVSYTRGRKVSVGFPVEIKLIGSQRFGAEYVYDEETATNRARKAVLDLLGLDPNNNVGASTTSSRFSAGSKWKSQSYSFTPVELIERKRTLDTATVTLKGDGISAVPLTVEKQAVRPLQATSWSWLVTSAKSGKVIMYISVAGITADGVPLSRVFPLTIDVQESYLSLIERFISDHWEWLAGTIIIPLGLFLWNIRKERAPGSRRRRKAALK